MLRYRLEIPSDVEEVLPHLPPRLKRSVRSTMRALTLNPNVGEPLREELEGLHKFRVRRYRIVYRILAAARTVRILAVAERRTVYEELARRVDPNRTDS